MVQAKGVLPRGEDREVLYKNPQTCGYFVTVHLDPAMDRARLESFLGNVDSLIERLVVRLPRERGEEKGKKVAAIAVGLAPRFFGDGTRFGIEPPTWFDSVPLPTVPAGVPIDADILFYIAATREARVNAFVNDLSTLAPDVQQVRLDRGYQREDETEPFGYKDGVRNILPRTERPRHVFVHRDGNELDEPTWADDGTYMAYLKIHQHPEAFAALPDDEARDATIGRRKDGTRLDLDGSAIDAEDEPADVPDALPPAAHVRKAGPRGRHDDTQIFRRGLPFVETSESGEVLVGLHFCSFQATLAQFDVVFNDWLMSRQFPPQQGGTDPGVDALLDPARGLTTIERSGFFFVPPFDERGLGAALFASPRAQRRKTGRLVVHKRVVDATDPRRRFERAGFRFRVLDAQAQPVAGAEFVTDSNGRGICPVELDVAANYTLEETFSEVANVELQSIGFTMAKPNKQLHVVNQVTEPNTPYGQL